MAGRWSRKMLGVYNVSKHQAFSMTRNAFMVSYMKEKRKK